MSKPITGIKPNTEPVKPWVPVCCVDPDCRWKGPAGKTLNRVGETIGDCPRCGLPAQRQGHE